MRFPLNIIDQSSPIIAELNSSHKLESSLIRIAVIGLVFCHASGVTAEDGERRLIRVEEDWVALIAEPDPSTSSPQILNVISPTQSASEVFGLIQVNHRDQPTFNEGGLQVQVRRGSGLIGTAQSSRTATLSRSNDSLKYTVAMQLTETGIRFELLNGTSRTWGRFAQSPVTVTVTEDSPTLEYYTPEFSTENTCVNLGAHRVELLYMNTTRRTFDNGDVVTDTTDRVLHRYQLKVEDVLRAAYEENPDEYTMDITEEQAPSGS